MEISVRDRRVAISSLHCSDEQGVSALRVASMLVICVLAAEFHRK